MKIILASTSPKRKALMDLLKIDYEICPSEFDEQFQEGLTMEEQSKRLAYMKAKTVFDKTSGDRIIIGADTMVIKDNKLYGKPKDKTEAIKMLNSIKNTYNTIITSMAVLIEENSKYKEYIDYDTAKVYLSDMTDSEIKIWVDSGEAFTRAGAYDVQGKFSIFINKIEGNFTSAIGLPINKLYQYIKEYL